MGCGRETDEEGGRALVENYELGIMNYEGRGEGKRGAEWSYLGRVDELILLDSEVIPI